MNLNADTLKTIALIVAAIAGAAWLTISIRKNKNSNNRKNITQTGNTVNNGDIIGGNKTSGDTVGRDKNTGDNVGGNKIN